MSGKAAKMFDAQRSLVRIQPAGEIVTVLAPGQGTLPRRRSRKGPTTIERFVAALGPLLDKDVTIAELHFTKALEARSPATLRAMTSDLASYATFIALHANAVETIPAGSLPLRARMGYNDGYAAHYR